MSDGDDDDDDDNTGDTWSFDDDNCEHIKTQHNYINYLLWYQRLSTDQIISNELNWLKSNQNYKSSQIYKDRFYEFHKKNFENFKKLLYKKFEILEEQLAEMVLEYEENSKLVGTELNHIDLDRQISLKIENRCVYLTPHVQTYESDDYDTDNLTSKINLVHYTKLIEYYKTWQSKNYNSNSKETSNENLINTFNQRLWLLLKRQEISRKYSLIDNFTYQLPISVEKFFRQQALKLSGSQVTECFTEWLVQL